MTGEDTSKGLRRDQRIVRHVKALNDAAGNDEAWRLALNAVRDDTTLSAAQRGAIHKTLAQQSLLWYVEACSGKPVDLDEVEARLAQHAKS